MRYRQWLSLSTASFLAVLSMTRFSQAAPVTATIDGTQIQLTSDTVSQTWTVTDGHLKTAELVDKLSGLKVPMTQEAFTLSFEKRKKLKASELKITSGPEIEVLQPDAGASRLSQRIAGKQIVMTMESQDGSVQCIYKLIGRDDTNYIRQELTIRAVKDDQPLRRIMLIDLPLRFPTVDAPITLKGAPVVSGNFFCGFEHPLADNMVGAYMSDSGHAEGSLERKTSIPAGQSFVCSGVIGVSHDGQMRRDFSQYLEHERAHPYRPFLHYNSWYDIGYFSRFDEAAALDVVNSFGTEMVKKRGVVLSSFLFDDGWDDPKTLWGFNPGFPNGFKAVHEAAEKYGADPGVWLSPWGGYGKPHEQRIEYGKQFGYETNAQGFSLSGPKYFDRFESVCKDMIKTYGVNQFKFDGTGDPTLQFPGSKFGSDFEAAIQLIQDLRTLKPDLFINLTTGTWPSPFWLRYADSIWRGGEDHAFAGVGTYRQRWMTYRDGDTYREIASVCPLYPLNSLMLHGVLYAKHAHNLDTDPGNDFESEVHTYFATGTQLQEMYVTPMLLTDKNWDDLAEAAKWARNNSETLIDSHWVGGDPNHGDVYGWASWSPKKGILVLRNPSDQPAKIDIDIAKAFELPPDAATRYHAHSPWQDEESLPAIDLEAGKIHTFEMKPFEVVSLEAVGKK
jgi:hypothetical protein